MILLTYDISNDKLRSKFVRFIEKYGTRMQYSVFYFDNSERVLKMIELEIKDKFEKKFEISDSVIIYRLCDKCTNRPIKYGYAKLDLEKFIVI